jgi:hypothetical protein
MRSNEQALQAELKRLRNIEHLAWHVCESSEDRVLGPDIIIDRADFEALASSLPEEHPTIRKQQGGSAMKIETNPGVSIHPGNVNNVQVEMQSGDQMTIAFKDKTGNTQSIVVSVRGAAMVVEHEQSNDALVIRRSGAQFVPFTIDV